jgi:predicted DNA binding CopG/RHH family protein
MNKKRAHKIPSFKNEVEERAFWENVDLAKEFSKEDFVLASFPNLKPTTSSISIRIPDHLLVRLKERSNKLNIPYQTLMKQYIAEGVEKHS